MAILAVDFEFINAYKLGIKLTWKIRNFQRWIHYSYLILIIFWEWAWNYKKQNFIKKLKLWNYKKLTRISTYRYMKKIKKWTRYWGLINSFKNCNAWHKFKEKKW